MQNKPKMAGTPLEEVKEGKDITQWRELTVQAQIITLFVSLLIMSKKRDDALRCINHVLKSSFNEKLAMANLHSLKGFCIYQGVDKNA